MKETGFQNVELVEETGFNSSPVTKGILIRAAKPIISIATKLDDPSLDPLDKYQEFLHAVYAEGALDRKTKQLIALGASLTIGSESWVERCLAIAKEFGATDEELKETMAIAMSVGAERIKSLQESSPTSLLMRATEESGQGLEEEPTKQDGAPS